MQMRSCPFFFMTVTMELTQSVSLYTRSITSKRSMHSSSFFTLDRIVTGTFRGGVDYRFAVRVQFNVVCNFGDATKAVEGVGILIQCVIC